MTDTVKPRDAKEVEEAVRWALDGDKPLEIVGGGSKRAVGTFDRGHLVRVESSVSRKISSRSTVLSVHCNF